MHKASASALRSARRVFCAAGSAAAGARTPVMAKLLNFLDKHGGGGDGDDGESPERAAVAGVGGGGSAGGGQVAGGAARGDDGEGPDEEGLAPLNGAAVRAPSPSSAVGTLDSPLLQWSPKDAAAAAAAAKIEAAAAASAPGVGARPGGAPAAPDVQAPAPGAVHHREAGIELHPRRVHHPHRAGSLFEKSLSGSLNMVEL